MRRISNGMCQACSDHEKVQFLLHFYKNIERMFLNPGGTRILHWPLSLSILLSLALSVSFCNECAIASSVSLYRIGGRCSYFTFCLFFLFFFFIKERAAKQEQHRRQVLRLRQVRMRIVYNATGLHLSLSYILIFGILKKNICEERARTDKEGSGGVCKAIECWTVLCKRL